MGLRRVLTNTMVETDPEIPEALRLEEHMGELMKDRKHSGWCLCALTS